MKLYFKLKNNGDACYYCEKNFDGAIEVDVDDEKLVNIKENYSIKIKGNKLVLEKPAYILEQERQTNLENLKTSITNATSVAQLKTQLLNLIKEINI